MCNMRCLKRLRTAVRKGNPPQAGTSRCQRLSELGLKRARGDSIPFRMPNRDFVEWRPVIARLTHN